MANDTNQVILCGRLVDSMQLRTTQKQYPIGNFTIAVNRSQKRTDANGQAQWEDKPSFFDCSFYGSAAKNLQLYLYKGKQVVVTGYLSQDRWEKDGQKFSRVRVVVTNLQLVGSKPQQGAQPQQAAQAPQQQEQYGNDFPAPQPWETEGSWSTNPDEVPF